MPDVSKILLTIQILNTNIITMENDKTTYWSQCYSLIDEAIKLKIKVLVPVQNCTDVYEAYIKNINKSIQDMNSNIDRDLKTIINNIDII